MSTTIILSIFVPVFLAVTTGLLWASHKYPKKYPKLVGNFWGGILIGCFVTVFLFGITVIRDAFSLHEALESGEYVASRA